LLRFGSLGEIIEACDDLRSLARKLEAINDEAKMLASAFISDALHADGKTSSGVLSQLLASPLINWSDPDVRLATDRTDFSATLLVEQPAVIVLKCPGRYMKGFGPYLSAILQKLMLDLDTIGERAGGALPRPVKIVIDEFPVMGKLDAVVEAVNLFRKRRISFVIAMQSIAQLYNIYGRDGAETLISGMATQIVFGSCDHATAHYVTQVLGKATRQVEATFTQSSDARSQRQVRVRDLMTVDEVISPSRGNCTILYRYATTTYAAQVVMLAALSYMFDRDDWQRAIQKVSGTASTYASENLVVSHNPFAGKKPQSLAQHAHADDQQAEGFVTGDF
jgi:type IV secretory pathway TraG/TraD family ATPase VirD4